MTTLLIPSKELAADLETDLEGRLEVMADDGLAGSPDFEDASGVVQVLREQTSFPATIDVSGAESAQALISLENLLDLDSFDNEQTRADCQAALAHISKQFRG